MAKIYVLANAASRVQTFEYAETDGYVAVDMPSFAVIGAILTGTTLTEPPGPPANAEILGQIDRSYEYWVRQIRNPNWPDTAPDLAIGQEALRAVNKYLYAQAAVCYLLATGAFLDSRGMAVTDKATQERAVAAYGHLCSVFAPAWYRLMLSDRTLRPAWASGSVADGAALFSDMVTADGIVTDRRVLGTARVALTGNAIPARFNPEQPGLLDPA